MQVSLAVLSLKVAQANLQVIIGPVSAEYQAIVGLRFRSYDP